MYLNATKLYGMPYTALCSGHLIDKQLLFIIFLKNSPLQNQGKEHPQITKKGPHMQDQHLSWRQGWEMDPSSGFYHLMKKQD